MKLQLIANIQSVSLGYLFNSGTEVTIGREIGNTIAPLVDSLSRHHAKIYTKDGAWYVEDLGSTNGSFLNGAKLEAPAKLESGAQLRFGTMSVSVELQADGAPASITPAEAAQRGAALAAAAAENAPTILTKPTIPGINETIAEPAKAVVPEAMKAPAPTPAPAPAPAPAAVKPGLKLPPKPALGAGIKLPPKPALNPAGLKLPPKPALNPAGLKLPPKPGVKLPVPPKA